MQNFAKFRDAVLKDLDAESGEAQQDKEVVDGQFIALQHEKADIEAKLGKTKLEINELAIWLGLPLFCVTVLLMLCVPIIVQSRKTNEASSEQIKAIFGSGILVEIITVLLLTMSILILGLAGKLTPEVLGTLIGGISGYVLNRFRGRPQSHEPPAK